MPSYKDATIAEKAPRPFGFCSLIGKNDDLVASHDKHGILKSYCNPPPVTGIFSVRSRQSIFSVRSRQGIFSVRSRQGIFSVRSRQGIFLWIITVSLTLLFVASEATRKMTCFFQKCFINKSRMYKYYFFKSLFT